MALDHSALLSLLDALRCSGSADLVRSPAEHLLQELIEAEATAQISAGPGERAETRTAWRNGHRPKTLSTRRLHVVGITEFPDGAWSAQRTREFAMAMGERLERMRFLIRDRGGQFTDPFDAVFESCGPRVLKSPPQAPRANAICERMIGTLRRELLDKTLILHEQHARRV